MLLSENDNIKVNPFYLKRSSTEFLGYLPVLDHDCNGYYTVANEHPNKEYERVSPVFGEYNDNIKTELEYWYSKDLTKNYKVREEDRLNHEYYRDEVLERVERCKYCVWFVGCDDGDKFMRFESKESALEFFTTVDFFDEITDLPECHNW